MQAHSQGQNQTQKKAQHFFQRFSNSISDATGTPFAFLAALSLVAIWLVTGPYFQWSDNHSFLINNSTTVITFLMSFLIQSSQRRDSIAMQLKLNELIRSNAEASNRMINLEEAEEEESNILRQEFKALRDEIEDIDD